MKRQRTLLVLSLVALAVGVLLLLDRGRPATDEQARGRDQLWPNFDRAAATEIAITRGATTTTLRHEAAGWYTADPRRRADDGAVEGLLGALAYARVERRIDDADAQSRARFGLDAPRVTLRVLGHTLRIGQDAPARTVYVSRDDDRAVLVVEHRLIETADLDPSLWRSRALTLVEPGDASRIAYADWTLERRNGWRLGRPVEARAADARVDALLQSLSRARAKRELDAAAGQGANGSTLALDGAAQARVLGPCPGFPAEALVVRADGAALCFAATDLNLLRAPVTTLYERRLFPLRLDDLLAADVGPLRLRREEGRWRIIAPAGAVGYARDEAVRAWLEPLLAAEAHGFVAAAPVGGVRVRLVTRDDDVTADVATTQARRAGETVTLELTTPLRLSTDPLPLQVAPDMTALSPRY